MIVAGCDTGSTTGKVAIMEGDKILGSSIIPALAISEKTSEVALEEALNGSGIKKEDIHYCVGTGYGRSVIPFAQKNLSEISCHGLGAFWANSKIRTIVDIGGQDCKVIRVDETGKVEDFVMNDKCAAGTGRFLMDVSKSLGFGVEELGPLSLRAQNIAELSSACSVFASSEVLTLLDENRPIEEIAAGLNQSVALRLISLVKRVGLEPEFIVSGGVSKNIGVVKMLEEKLQVKVQPIEYDPQLLGAIGAALFAQRVLQKGQRKTSRRKRERRETAS
jgi:predicted CoA-substrate-specific enzyme activase